MRYTSRTPLLAFVALAFFAAAVYVGSSAMAMRSRVMTEDDRYYLPPAVWLRAFCLGYNEAAADAVWIKTTLYFGRQFQDDFDTVRFTMNYLMTAVDLDPRYRTLYTIGSTLTMFQDHGRVSKRTVSMAIDLLERGTEAFPDDGEIRFQLGFAHYYEMRPFFLKDKTSPEARYHKEEGARLIGEAALMPGAPPYAARLSASIMDDAGLEDLVVEHLKALLAKETEPELRALLAEKLKEALGKAAERDIKETERLRQAWLDTMPYIPYDFFLTLEIDAPMAEWIDPLYRTNRLLNI